MNIEDLDFKVENSKIAQIIDYLKSDLFKPTVDLEDLDLEAVDRFIELFQLTILGIEIVDKSDLKTKRHRFFQIPFYNDVICYEDEERAYPMPAFKYTHRDFIYVFKKKILKVQRSPEVSFDEHTSEILSRLELL